MPEPHSGRLTAKPSGKFWIPMPIAKFLETSTKTYKQQCNTKTTKMIDFLKISIGNVPYKQYFVYMYNMIKEKLSDISLKY